MKRRSVLLSVLILLAAVSVHAQNKRDIAVREDKSKLAQDDSWFYDDLEQAMEVASDLKRPLMIVFR